MAGSSAATDRAGTYWFVGAAFKGHVEQTQRFFQEGIWEQYSPPEKNVALVKTMLPGDAIAIRLTFVRKNREGLPFDNRGHPVSVMAIRGVGRITANPGDGLRVEVAWDQSPELKRLREWYFFTSIGLVWKVQAKDWYSESLIDFAFHNAPQDLARFRNHPYWKERFGDRTPVRASFEWTKFMSAIADRLLAYRDRRPELLAGIAGMMKEYGELSYLNDEYRDGARGIPRDICPFTVIGTFNRGIRDEKRTAIAAKLAAFLGVTEPVPASFEGVPKLNNFKSFFYGYEKDRGTGDIDALWNVFERAIGRADSDAGDDASDFVSVFDRAMKVPGVAWNLTMGLYWMRPWEYLSLDARSRAYIEGKLGIGIGRRGPEEKLPGAEYLNLVENLKKRFLEESYPVHSFPELSNESMLYTEPISREDKSWKSAVYERVRDLCTKKGCDEFDRGEFLEAYQDELAELFPGNGSIPFSVSRALQALRDEEKLDFLERGRYRLLDFAPEAPVLQPLPMKPYSIESIIDDGCFLEREELGGILELLRTKRNIILQGAPGTGKTWLAKQLAFAWIGERDENRVRAVQFHPNLSYEDFVRGYRPSGEGTLSLTDGPFLEMANAAREEPEKKHVLVIEEINRGNPAQIFGEMLTLLESDKRNPDAALELCYRKGESERVHIPANLYVIGTMNIADRSLALVDYALRRRFAFVDLEPRFGGPWREWLAKKWGFDAAFLDEIEKRILELNDVIAADSGLGRQFRIGHSYVIPSNSDPIADPKEWFLGVVRTQIGPLLDEYWFDAPGKVEGAKKRLVTDL